MIIQVSEVAQTYDKHDELSGIYNEIQSVRKGHCSGFMRFPVLRRPIQEAPAERMCCRADNRKLPQGWMPCGCSLMLAFVTLQTLP